MNFAKQFAILCIGLFLTLGPSRADPSLVPRIHEIFQNTHDWLQFKLALDELVDPAIKSDMIAAEVSVLKSQLEKLVQSQQPRTAHEKLKLLKQFYYQAGDWNGNRAFAYDLDDPLGKITKHKTLGHYVNTRKGNCITMPILFAILGHSIGLKMTLAIAPLHMFVRFTDDEGREWNLETTSGAGYTRDSHYRKNLPMTDKAVSEGIYLRGLSDQEAMAEIATTAAANFLGQRKPLETIIVAEAILKRHPKSVYATIARASAFALILQDKYIPRLKQLTKIEADEAWAFSEQNRLGFAYAESLGWTENDGMPKRWPPYVLKAGEE